MHPKHCAIITTLTILCLLTPAPAADLAQIPRIDVHAHIGTPARMNHFLEVAKVLERDHDAKLEIWIDLNFARDLTAETNTLLMAYEKHKGRFLPCINDYKIADGLHYKADQLAKWKDRGIVGYKIWVGVSPLIDDPAYDPIFAEMTRLKLPGVSIHISQPCPTKWCEDPVKFWQAHNAWERVLDRHPNLTVINAHMLDHFNSDEQLDYLAYILETYPNVHVDLAARFQQFHQMDRDKLREFFIKYADRILYGTDISSTADNGNYAETARRYNRTFQLLETDRIINGGFFGSTPTKGLDLPEQVLKKIYHQNAARLYPKVKQVLQDLGCKTN